MFKNFLKILTLLIVVFVCISPLFVFAQNTTSNPTPNTTSNNNPNTTSNSNSRITIEFKNPFKGGGTTVYDFLKSIYDNILLPIGGVVAAIMVMYAGFLYVTAAGNTSQIAKAHNALLYAVVGAAILLGSWIIQEAISNTIKQFKV